MMQNTSAGLVYHPMTGRGGTESSAEFVQLPQSNMIVLLLS